MAYAVAFATIIMAFATVTIAFQIEKAARMLSLINRFLLETSDANNERR